MELKWKNVELINLRENICENYLENIFNGF